MAKTLFGQLQNKNSTNKKDSKTHLCVALIAVQQRKLAWATPEEEGDKDNLSRLPAHNVEIKTQCLSNHEVTDQFFVEIVSEKENNHFKTKDSMEKREAIFYDPCYFFGKNGCHLFEPERFA